FILSSCLRKYRCPDNPVNSGLKRKQLPKGKEWRGAIQRPSHFLDALFDKAENHITVVKALASKWKGLTRKEIVAATGLSNSGSLTRILEELEKSSFIQTYYPLGKKKKGSL
ncbi:MAG: hypothetical protein KDD28_25645, partial [Phaeodactylibacter sp.]|nr:hypothetical protein [Phaeodactylibacter sp.]